MANTIVEQLGQEIDRISAVYESSFAGQSRGTRDLEDLDGLIRRTRDVVGQIEKIPAAALGPDLTRIREVAQSNLKLYETERQAIVEAKKAGPDFEEFSRLASGANFVFARYFRHFANQSRATRDLGLLAEMVEDLKQLRQRMNALVSRSKSDIFSKDAEVVASSLEMYQKEIREITAAQSSGTVEERANLFAELANNQFEVYRVHFAGRARVTRRPALLQRVIANLKRIRESMQSLENEAASIDFNAKNIAVVDNNLQTYEAELNEIRKMRQATKMDDIMAMLGSAANEEFDAYRKGYSGKDRRTVDLAALGQLCDRLGEILRQMLDLGRAEQHEMNERNIEIVIEQLGLFEREFEAVSQAQRAMATS